MSNWALFTDRYHLTTVGEVLKELVHQDIKKIENIQDQIKNALQQQKEINDIKQSTRVTVVMVTKHTEDKS